MQIFNVSPVFILIQGSIQPSPDNLTGLCGWSIKSLIYAGNAGVTNNTEKIETDINYL